MKVRAVFHWLAAVLWSLPGAALAQSGPVSVGGFPDGPLRIIVPASAGGGFDGTARAIQEVLRDDKITTQAVEVINVTGSGVTAGSTDPPDVLTNPTPNCGTGVAGASISSLAVFLAFMGVRRRY